MVAEARELTYNDEDKYSSKIKLDHSNNKLEIFKNTLNRQNYRISPTQNIRYEKQVSTAYQNINEQLPNINYDRRYSPTYVNQNIRKSRKILKKLENIQFNFNNTVGPKSISKPELIKEFNLTEHYAFVTNKSS